MKLKTASWLMACTLLVSLGANGQSYDHLYISGNVGPAMPTTAETTDSTLPGVTIDLGYDTGVAFSGAIGAANGAYRAEVELGYQTNDLDAIGLYGNTVPVNAAGISGDQSIFTGLVNIYYDFDLGNGLHPFLTGGVGVANVDVSVSIPNLGSASDNDTVFAYQAGGGIAYDFSENVTAEVKYRYLGAHDIEIDTATTEVQTHNITFGLRFRY